MTYVPIPLIAYFGYCLGYNIFVAHAIIKSILWIFPFAFITGFRMNITSNAKVLIDTIYLLESGTQFEVKNVNGNH
jgi:hypothetical protein